MNFFSDLFIRSFTLFIRLLPVSCYGALARIIEELAFRFSSRDNKIMKLNIERVLKIPADTHFSDMFRRQVFRHQIISALESIRSVYNPELLKISGFDEFQRCLAVHSGGPQGLVAITGHMGSWEICARYCVKALPSAFHVLAKPSSNIAFKNFLERLRNKVGASVFWTDKKSLIKDILGALKKKETVGFVMDQKPENRKGPIVDFFGRPTEFVSGPATMACRTGAPVAAVYCMRVGAFHYRLYAECLVPQGHEIKDEQIVTQKSAKSIEDIIRAYPEQWTWNYKRWRF
jgi:KDO2-lipid IV(A) lauroyltransferase